MALSALDNSLLLATLTFLPCTCFYRCESEVIEMKKTGILLAFAVALLLSVAAAPKANAAVAVRVAVGVPVYVHPAPRYYAVPPPYGPYVRGVVYVPAPVYRRVYVAPAPVYYRRWHPRPYVARRYWR